jgi:hypothetical protein
MEAVYKCPPDKGESSAERSQGVSFLRLLDPDLLVGLSVEFIDRLVDLFVRGILDPPGSRPKRWTGTAHPLCGPSHYVYLILKA